MTGARVLTAAILIPVVVAAVLWANTWIIAGLVAAVMLICLHEFFRLSATAGLGGHPRWTTICALLLVSLECLEAMGQGIWSHTDFGVLYAPDRIPLPPDVALAIFLLGASALVVMERAPLKEALPRLGTDCAAMMLVAFPLGFIVRLHGMQTLGPRLLLFLLVVLWVGDTLAYFTGRAIGRHKLAPELSPGKTWEGSAANLLGAVLVGFAGARWIQLPAFHPTFHLVFMAVLANIAGQIGDLTESAYKRSAGVKDSGTLLPGHGGMLDRVDSLIFAAPVVWYYFRMVVTVLS